MTARISLVAVLAVMAGSAFRPGAASGPVDDRKSTEHAERPDGAEHHAGSRGASRH